MTKYDELRPIYKTWREKYYNISQEYRSLPDKVAAHLKIYLGTPDYWEESEAGGSDKKQFPYVTPAVATANGDGFQLEIEQGMPRFDFQEDGYFYFGVVVFMELSANSWPKEPFWTLLKAIRYGDCFEVTNIRSAHVFRIDPNKSGDFAPLCIDIFNDMKSELQNEPDLSPKSKKQQIGFNLKISE